MDFLHTFTLVIDIIRHGDICQLQLDKHMAIVGTTVA